MGRGLAEGQGFGEEDGGPWGWGLCAGCSVKSFLAIFQPSTPPLPFAFSFAS